MLLRNYAESIEKVEFWPGGVQLLLSGLAALPFCPLCCSYITRQLPLFNNRRCKIDPGFFIRPFTEISWLLIFISFIFLFFLSLVIQFFDKSDKRASKSIIELTAWFLFVMLYAYYGGAMTMFFAVEPSLPFKTIDEAMLANPPWNYSKWEWNFCQIKRKLSTLYKRHWKSRWSYCPIHWWRQE